MTRLLLLSLPTDPRGASASRPWWLVEDGAIVKSGRDSSWTLVEDTTVIGIADPAASRLVPIPKEARGNAQLTTKALIEIRSASLGEDTHVVAGEDAIALVDRPALARWQAWADDHGAGLDHIVPLAGLMPIAATWHRANVGDWTVLAKDRQVALDEPGLSEALTAGETVDSWPPSVVDRWIASARPHYDFLGGRKRRRPVPLDRSVLKRIGAIAAILLLLLAFAPVVELARWNNEAERLDGRSAALASETLGRSVTAEEAEGALRGERISPDASPATMLAALTQAMDAAPTVRATRIDYAAGRLSVELVASDPAAIRRVVNALGRSSWRLASQPTQAAGGQAGMLLDMEAW